jgi:uncharacterized protein YggT (Ycf19 family)
MNEIPLRLLFLLRFVSFLALFYLLLEGLVSFVIKNRESKIRGFFALVTSPLTAPARAAMPSGSSDSAIRWVTLLAVFLVWLAATLLLRTLVPSAV